MRSLSIPWSEVKQRILEVPGAAEAYAELEPEYEIISEIIRARLEQNLSQEELAMRIGTRQANISRLESGLYNPSLRFLKKVAEGLGKRLHISLC